MSNSPFFYKHRDEKIIRDFEKLFPLYVKGKSLMKQIEIRLARKYGKTRSRIRQIIAPKKKELVKKAWESFNNHSEK
jgi:hypothetical protein